MESASVDPFQRNEKLQKGSFEYLEGYNEETSLGLSGKSEREYHFTPELRQLYKLKFGQLLIDLGYERDLTW